MGLAALVECSADGIAVVDGGGEILFLNPAAARILAPTGDALVGRTLERAPGAGETVELELAGPGGEPRIVEVQATALEWQGSPARLLNLRDVTDHRQTLRALRASRERNRLALSATSDGFWDWEVDEGSVTYSPRWMALLGLPERSVKGSPEAWFDRVHPADRETLQCAVDALLEGRVDRLDHEHRMRHANGEYRWMLCRGRAVPGPEQRPARLVGSQSDVHGRREAEERLRFQVLHDDLTGLPNRTHFIDSLGRSLARSRRSEDFAFAVLFLDLDRFKIVNDSLGHLAGDRLLVAVARRLEACIRPRDIVARLGGDEFTVLVDGIHHARDALRIARRIQKEVQKPVDVDGQEVFTTASIGLALSSERYERPEDILRDADTAMYRSKENGTGGIQVFDPAMHSEVLAALQLEAELRRALERGELCLHYQPIVALDDGAIRGFEALVRWLHPTRGLLEPAAFLGLAEETGEVAAIDSRVLGEACRQLADWRSRLKPARALSIHVNLSARELLGTRLPSRVQAVLADTGLEPRDLVIELTERAFFDQPERAANLYERLRRLGVRLYLDDFGTGYFSLAPLERLEPDALKIDGSFVRRLDPQPGRPDGPDRMVRAIAGLAESLGLAVVAEGVESEGQLQSLRELGCPYGQGRHFHGPVAAAAAERLIAGGA